MSRFEKISTVLGVCLACFVLTATLFISSCKAPEESFGGDFEKESAANSSFECVEPSSPEAPVPSENEQPSPSEPEELPTPSERPEEPQLPLTEVWYYNGIRLGNKEEGQSKEDLLFETAALLDKDFLIDGTLTVVKEHSSLPALTLSEAAKKLAHTVFEEYTRGWALYINDRLFAVTEEKTDLENAIDRFLAEQKLKENQHCELRGTVFFEDFAVKKDRVMNEDEVFSLLGLCGHLTLEKLPQVNYDQIDRFLEGAELPEISPVIITEEELVLTESVPFEFVERLDGSMYEGSKKLLQSGRAGSRTLTYKVIYEDGKESARILVSNELTVAPVDEIYLVGAMKKGTATGKLIWPTKEGYISSRYGYRYLFEEYKLHGGLDIAIVTGTALYAADGGTVVHAGDAGNTYGIYVIIDHGNGMRTLYAHMSKVSVKKGDLVNQGDLIGKSGATGRVTGPHLHFEVRVDGARLDPEKYLPTKR